MPGLLPKKGCNEYRRATREDPPAVGTHLAETDQAKACFSASSRLRTFICYAAPMHTHNHIHLQMCVCIRICACMCTRAHLYVYVYTPQGTLRVISTHRAANIDQMWTAMGKFGV